VELSPQKNGKGETGAKRKKTGPFGAAVSGGIAYSRQKEKL